MQSDFMGNWPGFTCVSFADVSSPGQLRQSSPKQKGPAETPLRDSVGLLSAKEASLLLALVGTEGTQHLAGSLRSLGVGAIPASWLGLTTAFPCSVNFSVHVQ